MASVFYPLGRKIKNKKRPLILAWKDWEGLCQDHSALQALLHKGYKPHDVLEQYIAAFQPGGAFSVHGTAARQLALAFIKRHGVVLCKEVPVDAVRTLYEVVSEQSARPADDGVQGASRIQMLALDALTALLIGLRVHESDPRLLKVHVQRVYRDLDPRAPAIAPPGSFSSGGSGGAGLTPELHHRVAASDCLRSIEAAFPGMLLAGGGRLLELSLAEADGAAPAATQLAVMVLSHAADRYLAQQAAAAAATVHAPATAQQTAVGGASSRSGSGRLSSCREEGLSTVGQPSSGATSPLAPSATDGYSSDGHECRLPRPPSPSHEESEYSSKRAPSSPRGIASPAARGAMSAATTASVGSLGGSARAGSLPSSEAAAAAAAAAAGHGLQKTSSGGSLARQSGGGGTGSGGGEIPLLSKSPTGLRHFYVPEYYKGPSSPGLEGCQLVLTSEAKERLQAAVPHFLRLLPRVVPEDLQQTAALLAPLLRVAECPTKDLQPLLEKHLRSNNLPLIQAVLMLLDELPSAYEPWEDDLAGQLFRILVGRSATDLRIAALSWLLRRHHQQRYSKEPSLFEANWRAVLPAERDDVQLLTLKVKALTACIASGIGDVWEMAEALNAWDGFWAVSPSPQQLRAAAYMLRMLCFAECQLSCGCNEHRLKAIVVSVVVQMAATRPQYLPAVESFMQHCDPAVRAVTLAAFNMLFVVAAPPLSPTRSSKAALAPVEFSTVSSVADSSIDARPPPSEHSVRHSSTHSAPSEGSSPRSEEQGGEEGLQQQQAGEVGSESGSESASEHTAATQGTGSNAKGSSRVPSAFASPEPPARGRPALYRKSSGNLGGEEEGPTFQHQHQHRHRHRPHRELEARLDEIQSAPQASAFAAVAAMGSDQGEPARPPPINTGRSSTAVPFPAQQVQRGTAATPTRRQGSQPLSARFSASLPAFFSRLRSHPEPMQPAPQQQQQQPQERERSQQAEASPGGAQDKAVRASMVRSASFSAIAAAAGWIKAQHWLMHPENFVLGPAPQPPDSITTWEAAQAWLTSSATWESLSGVVLQHDAMLYRTLLLEIVQSSALCPLGALSFLEQYIRRYIGELPGDALPPQQVGTALLAICQATVMTHLFDPGCLDGSGWSEDQADVAQAVQRLLAILSTAFPVVQTRHKAGAFLQHLSAATSASQGQLDSASAAGTGSGDAQGGWQLVRQLLASYMAEAIAGGTSPPQV